jgi:asparagine synthase (glutamine-hydrolysing)
MCGIAGIIAKNKQPDLQQLKQMTDSIVHRGPDDEGLLIDGRVGLGHRRLSIIDLSAAGHQPMSYADNKYTIVFNGEIYNYLEIKEALRKQGYQFSSHSDTEVILAAYQCWGEECVQRFNGMWAFAIHDKVQKTVFCSRDRFGIKPFYFINNSDLFAFGSEIKQFKGLLPDFSFDEEVLYNFLVYGGLFYNERTCYANILTLPGAHNLVYDLEQGTYCTYRYWDLDAKKKTVYKTEAEYIKAFRDLFFDSVRLHLRSDVPVGSCLSGGLDSSALVCTVNEFLRKEGKSANQSTFSFCSKYAQYDERKHIEKVIQKTNATPYYTYPDSNDLFQTLHTLAYYQEAPFNSTSMFAQYEVFRLVHSKNVKVVINGQGADELLGGYPFFYGFYLIDLLCKGKLPTFVKEFKNYHTLFGGSLLRTLVEVFVLSVPWLEYGLRDIFRLNRPKWLSLKRKYPLYKKQLKVPKFNSLLKKRLYEAVFYSKLPELLHYEDVNSMAFSVESRVPFLDYRIVEFLFSIPDKFIIRAGWTKYILRQALQDVLPPDIAQRKDKMGYATPEEVWMKKENPQKFIDFFEENLHGGILNILDKKEIIKDFKAMLAEKKQYTWFPMRWITTILSRNTMNNKILK